MAKQKLKRNESPHPLRRTVSAETHLSSSGYFRPVCWTEREIDPDRTKAGDSAETSFKQFFSG